MGGADVGLLLSLCDANGKLLKPDKPARSVDAVWTSLVPGAAKSLGAFRISLAPPLSSAGALCSGPSRFIAAPLGRTLPVPEYGRI